MTETDRIPSLEPPENLTATGKRKGWKRRRHELVIEGPGTLVPVVVPPERLRKKPRRVRKDIGELNDTE